MWRTILRQVRRRVGLLLTPIFLAGCGAPTPGTVTGKVTIRGAVPRSNDLTVNLLGVAGQSVSVPLQPDGSFTIPDVPPGLVRLGVSALDLEPQVGEQAPVGRVDRQFTAIKPSRRPPPRQPFAEKYVNPRTSGFSVAVEPGQIAVLDINIP